MKVNNKLLINKWEYGSWIFVTICSLGVILFFNRYDILFFSREIADMCIKEHVKFWEYGNLQLLRSFLEHLSFNFLVPIIFVIFSLGFDKLFNKTNNWGIAFFIGAGCSLFVTLVWEFQKKPVEILEILYDLAAITLSFIFATWMLKEFDTKRKS